MAMISTEGRKSVICGTIFFFNLQLIMAHNVYLKGRFTCYVMQFIYLKVTLVL